MMLRVSECVYVVYVSLCHALWLDGIDEIREGERVCM